VQMKMRRPKSLMVTLYDKDFIGSDYLGYFEFPLEDAFSGDGHPIIFDSEMAQPIWIPLESSRKRLKVTGEVCVKIGWSFPASYSPPASYLPGSLAGPASARPQKVPAGLTKVQERLNEEVEGENLTGEVVGATLDDREFSAAFLECSRMAQPVGPVDEDALAFHHLTIGAATTGEYSLDGGGSDLHGIFDLPLDAMERGGADLLSTSSSVPALVSDDVSNNRTDDSIASKSSSLVPKSTAYETAPPLFGNHLGLLTIKIVSARDLPKLRGFVPRRFDMDPFVVASLGDKSFKTRFKRHTVKPTWNELVYLYVLFFIILL
jgi:hypothetical protein